MAEDFDTTVRASGGSLVVTIPRKVAEEKALKPGVRVHVRLFRGADISHLFGILKDRPKLDYRKLRSRNDYE